MSALIPLLNRISGRDDQSQIVAPRKTSGLEEVTRCADSKLKTVKLKYRARSASSRNLAKPPNHCTRGSSKGIGIVSSKAVTSIRGTPRQQPNQTSRSRGSISKDRQSNKKASDAIVAILPTDDVSVSSSTTVLVNHSQRHRKYVGCTGVTVDIRVSERLISIQSRSGSHNSLVDIPQLIRFPSDRSLGSKRSRKQTLDSDNRKTPAAVIQPLGYTEVKGNTPRAA
jgi:hypothetical protein